MLVLGRRIGEKVVLRDRATGAVLCKVCMVESRSKHGRIGFEAEDGVEILREELFEASTSDRCGESPAASA